MDLYFISPLPLQARGSSVILCSFTHLFPSSLLMLPVVHRGAGSAPKQAESQWWCVSPQPSPSPTSIWAQPPFPLSFISTYSWFSPSTPFLAFRPLYLSCISYCLLLFYSPCLTHLSIFCLCLQRDSVFLNRPDTQSWHLLPLLTSSLCSPKPTPASRLYCIGSMTPPPGSGLADPEHPTERQRQAIMAC